MTNNKITNNSITNNNNQIDLNCDMGELLPNQSKNFDAEIMPYISSCNIACGFHSGNPLTIENTIQSAIKHQVKIGAHPSYNDSENFGRVSMQTDFKTLKAELNYQIGALKSMVESHGQRLNHVKPHGALYNDMMQNAELAELFIKTVKAIDPRLKIYVLAHSEAEKLCEKEGMPFVREAFADRRYQTIRALRSRQFSDAVLHEKEDVLRQIGHFIEGKVQVYEGEFCAINVDTICLHSDTKGAVDLAKNIHQYLIGNNVEIKSID